MADNIILVGMPASGKSTIGQLLSEKLPDYTFIDTDSVIEKTQGISISDIFENFSEDYFRKIEYDTIKMICSGEKKIISVGGGAFENPDTRGSLLKFGKVFYLKSDLDVLYCRIAKDMTRPLFKNKDLREVLKYLADKRESNYQKAHYTVDSSLENTEEIINYIMEKINATES